MIHNTTKLSYRAVAAIAVALIGVGSAGCDRTGGERRTVDPITAVELAEHTRALSDDRMMGRGPGEEGETVTLEYLQSAFERIGLEPAGDTARPDGSLGTPSYLRRVDLVGIKPDGETASLKFVGRAGEPLPDLEYGDDFMIRASTAEEVFNVSGGAVFAGYGVDAPEEGWDDYKDVDVSGKIAFIMPGEPPTGDPDRFGGEAMTYYGRWSYKIEEAARRGAAGVVLIHDPDTAGYSWQLITSRTGEGLQKAGLSVLPPRTPLSGWINGDSAAKLFRAAGFDLGVLAEAAAGDGFTAIDLGFTASAHLDNTVREITSYNVAGTVTGSDPALAGEHVVFVAHWDHLGIGEAVDGDDIYNGAIDNAIGTAALLEIAAAWASTEPPPRRSAIFVATTAEESGFLGVVSYIETPVLPLVDAVAAINIDGVNVFGSTEDVWIVGEGLNTIEDDLVAVLAKQGRRLSPDPVPEQGNWFRSDHFPFALAGIPALCIRPGLTFTDQPGGSAGEVWAEWYRTHYHRPSDEFDESWDFDSTVEDTQLTLDVALRVADADGRPAWKPSGAAYEAAREKMSRVDLQ